MEGDRLPILALGGLPLIYIYMDISKMNKNS